ncbi:MAG: 3-isopropylmalate dehydratase [Thermoprotei archaeon]|nr:MAG: 3-isopropylmalate dehydratase [Thermoprotei archaeon]RLF20102.1 MAG: 3-isopropylmalate dehydratase [Thermoprotei archaeon]
MTTIKVKGRVWKLGDNIDTDVITPGKYLSLPMDQLKQHVLEPINPDFAKQVQPGDVIVGGRNFGCGSSREQAPRALKEVGVAAVIAESFARIFFRNAISIGLPVLICEGVSSAFDEGDVLEADLSTGEIKNLTKGTTLKAKPLPPMMLEILSAGGALELLKKKFAQ